MKGRNIRLSLCIVSFICIAIITGCGKDSPKTTVNRFCSALKRYDFDTMRQYVVPSTSDQNMNKTDTSATSDVLDDYFKDNAKKIRYKIGDVEENGDTANITVTFDYLDARIPFSAALQDYLQQAFTSAFAGINISQEEIDQMLVNLFYEKQKSDKPSRTKKSVSLQCIKNDGEWKIESVPDEIMDVMTCNLYSTFQELADSNDNNDDEINTNDADSETWSEELAEDEPKDERVVVEFHWFTLAGML